MERERELVRGKGVREMGRERDGEKYREGREREMERAIEGAGR